MSRFVNMGNTCYINSILSILSNISLETIYNNNNNSNLINNILIDELKNILELSKNNDNIILPTRYIKFNSQLFKIKNKNNLMINEQCDSTEYLIFILDMISEVNLNIKNIFEISFDIYKNDKVEISQNNWIFYLNIPNINLTLDECIYLNVKGYENPKGDIVSMSFKKFPQILIFQYNHLNMGVKLTEHLDLSKYNNDVPITYKLFGIINYVGNAINGHYFTYIKEGDKWYNYDDTSKNIIKNYSCKYNYCLFFKINE